MMKHKRGKKKEETPYKVNFPNLKDKTLQTETEWKFSDQGSRCLCASNSELKMRRSNEFNTLNALQPRILASVKLAISVSTEQTFSDIQDFLYNFLQQKSGGNPETVRKQN